jgi:hypothetical protein
MTKTTEQIREEAERRYPYLDNPFHNPNIEAIVDLQRATFEAACNWLQSEQTPTPPQGDHELDLQYPMLQGETTDPTAKRFITKEKIEKFSSMIPPLGDEVKDDIDRARELKKKILADPVDAVWAILQFIQPYNSELTALRSQLSEAQENYEKVWDAAEARFNFLLHFYSRPSSTPPPDKTTFINKIKKGKE